MLSKDDIARSAARLDEAEQTRRQIGHLSSLFPGMDMADAYAIQDAWVKTKKKAGRKSIGWKIGLTSKAMQAALAIDIPDSGVLFDDMLFDDGATVPAGRFIQPRVEAELCFVFRKPLKGPDATMLDVMRATEFVIPSLEILDTRILRVDPETGRTRTVFDTIADNAANAGIVIGGRAMDPGETDLRWIGSIVSRNAVVEETGLAAGVLNHPAQSVAWLVNRLARYGGGIEAGELVLSGSFIRPIEAVSGSTITADFGPAGTVSCHFA